MHIFTFIKFGREKDIIDLSENGTIFLNTIDYFRKCEQLNPKGDKYEGASSIENLPSGLFTISIKGKPLIDRQFKYEKFHIMEAYENVTGNIYSLYSITSKHLEEGNLSFSPDSRLKDLGSHFLCITNLPMFLSMIEQSFQDNGLDYRKGFVDYYDKDSYNGKLTVFHKPNEFSYQNEFRFYIKNDKIEPLIIKIGSLKTISQVVESKHLDTLSISIIKNNSTQQSV